MDYKIPQQDDGATEVREPAVAYYPGVRTAAEPWMANVSDEPDDEPLTATGGEDWLDWRMKNVPGFKEAFLRWLEEGEIEQAASGNKTYTTDEVFAELEWCIEHNQWDDVKERLRKNGRI
jgi:hypothetical protein